MKSSHKYKYLGKIDTPEKLKKIPRKELDPLISEVREYLVDRVTENGGHLASNLGAVELSLAILRCFDLPKDHIIWDVGHQSYVYKMFTGRFGAFDTLRKNGGVSGFSRMNESEYDCFGAGHSSTSVSAGLGFAQADKLSGSDAFTVVILGDGAFTGGMIHEALNNIDPDLRLIVIINENEMSISRNIGRLANSLSHIRRTPGYVNTKRATRRAVKNIPLVGDRLYKTMRSTKQLVKNALYGSNFFEDLGLFYLGPADGNDYNAVEALIKEAKSQHESVIIHLKTKKGKGYSPAEENPNLYHGMAPSECKKPDATFSEEFGKAISAIAEKDKSICAITAAMSEGTGLTDFKYRYPDRFFDVGIAEEHAVTFASGLAANGMKPVFAVYSTFLQRGYDQMLHDVAIQGLPVIFCVDRAGLNAHDGITHHGVFDVAFTLQLPGFEIYAPTTYDSLRTVLERSLNSKSPTLIRYPSGEQKSELLSFEYSFEESFVKTSKNYKKSKFDAVIITYGNIAAEAVAASEKLAAEGTCVGIILCERLDITNALTDAVSSLLPVGRIPIIFLEEGVKNGGFSMVLADKLRDHKTFANKPYRIMAIDHITRPATLGESVCETFGLDSGSIIKVIKEMR